MSLDQLLTRFNNLQMQNAPSQTHPIELFFPACDLLPGHGREDTLPYLDPPKHVAHRSRPPKDPNTLGLLDTSFHAIISRNTASGLLPEDGAHGYLLKTLEDLRFVAGRSKLRFVSFLDDTGRFIYRFCLETTTTSDKSVKRGFELSENEVDTLFEVAKSNDCVAMIQHLISRESYRAYYHVRKQLSDTYGNVIAQMEEASWDVEWAASQQRELKGSFLAKLAALPADSTCGQETVRYVLPCDHEMATTDAALRSMDQEACLFASCQACGVRFLTGTDLLGFEVGLASIRCNRAARIHAHWTQLDRTPSPVKYGFDGRTLFEGLKAALRGFATSDLISPASQSIARHISIEAIMSYLEKILVGTDSIREEMPETMIVLLIDEVLKAVKCDDGTSLGDSSLPPGYGRFLRGWILRAVNFVTDRKCDPPACRPGIHRHDRQLVYGSTAGGVVDDGKMPLTCGDDQDRVPTSMEALEAELAEMDLEGTSSLYKTFGSMGMDTRPDDDSMT